MDVDMIFIILDLYTNKMDFKEINKDAVKVQTYVRLNTNTDFTTEELQITAITPLIQGFCFLNCLDWFNISSCLQVWNFAFLNPLEQILFITFSHLQFFFFQAIKINCLFVM